MIVELDSWRVVHVGVTAHPSDEWVAQQLRQATPFGGGPKHLIRDNDSKYGVHFANVAAGANIDVIATPYHTPKANDMSGFTPEMPDSVYDDVTDDVDEEEDADL